MRRPLTCVEICAGAGGQALGLAMAGFVHVALVEYEQEYCNVLKANRPEWNVICADVHKFDGHPYEGVDLLAGGVPCPPFSVAGKQLGKDDERDLFPEAIRLIREIRPRAVMLENVRGFLDSGFEEYRDHIFTEIKKLGYVTHIKLLNASDYGVPQLRPRVVIVGIRKDQAGAFEYPQEHPRESPTVGETLCDLMSQNGWKGAKKWAEGADRIAPTLVGGSKKHGGPDLGPTRAKNAWAELGVDANLARRAGLLHDIGKALSYEIEGSHVQIGVDVCKKYKESPEVIHAIEAHHGDVETRTVVAALVQAADAISAARPGARSENYENYIKRLQKLEEICTSYEGVEKSFAIQAGREVRIMVKPEVINDERMLPLAREICKKIEEELEYPGQIKVNIIRESRAVNYAK